MTFDLSAAMLVASLVVLLAALLIGRHRWYTSTYASWLERTCVVTIGARSYLAKCVAVSHRGAVAVRGMTVHNRKTVWIPKDDVQRCVRWCE